MPAVFVSHGAPTMALDRLAGADFARLAAALPKPRAILVVSAHWLDAPATIGTRTRRELMYDFSGFPDELYKMEGPGWEGSKQTCASLQAAHLAKAKTKAKAGAKRT